jgi:hypothetical protein
LSKAGHGPANIVTDKENSAKTWNIMTTWLHSDPPNFKWLQ